MKFYIKNFFSECDQIHSFLQIWSHLLKKFLMKNFFVRCLPRIYSHLATKKNLIGKLHHLCSDKWIKWNRLLLQKFPKALSYIECKFWRIWAFIIFRHFFYNLCKCQEIRRFLTGKIIYTENQKYDASSKNFVICQFHSEH